MADKKKFLDNNGLSHFWLLLKERFVKKEYKTGSESEYKVLSDNNLTDELVEKIRNAGGGNYNDLNGIPTLDGQQLKGALTKDDLNIASKSDIPKDTADLTNGAGFLKESDLKDKGYQTESDVEKAITETTTDMATQTWVNSQLANINKKEVVTSTDQMIDSNTIYLIANKGSGENIYDEYIVVNGKPEKIGTTEIDLTGFIKDTDLEAIQNEEIDAMFEE